MHFAGLLWDQAFVFDFLDCCHFSRILGRKREVGTFRKPSGPSADPLR